MNHNVVIVSDTEEGVLGGMVSRVHRELGGGGTVVNLEKMKMAGGCIGCRRIRP